MTEESGSALFPPYYPFGKCDMKKKAAFGLGVIVGRFQCIHSGHEKMIETALSVCDEVAVFIGSSQESGTNKNPFTYDLRREMLQRIYGGKVRIFPLPDAGLGNCAAWGEYVVDNVVKRCGRAPDVSVSGKEERRSSWLEGKSGESIAEIYVPKTVAMSATQMRKFFEEDDLESWKKYTNPALWDMYGELREAVLSSKDNKTTNSI